MDSLGYIFKKTRERRRLNIEQVYKQTKVQPQYLRAIEKDDYSIFSSPVHAKGFIKIYSDFLGLNSQEILALWRRDYSLVIKKTELETPKKLLKTNEFIVTPSTVLIGIFTVLVVVFFGYLFYQYKSFTGDPNLEIYEPQNNAIFETDVIEIKGKTDIEADVFINNQRIEVGLDGSFITTIKLNPGLNSLVVSTKNKVNRGSEKVITVIYKQPMLPVAPESTPSEDLEVLETTPAEELSQ